MTDAAPSTRLIPLGSEAVSYPLVPPPAIASTDYAAPGRFLDLPPNTDLATLSQLAEQLLQDPLALQQLSDRVLELLHQDLERQQERSRGYGRRW
jgi:hypothetical protein